MSRVPLSLFFAGLLCTTASADFDHAIAAYQQQHFEQAFNEFQRLAELGDAPSQRNLAVMYARGEHVSKDVIEAWAWAALSATTGDEASVAVRDALGTKLNDEQRPLADARFAEMQQQYGEAALTERLLPVVADQKADCTVDVLGDANPIATKSPRYPQTAIRKEVEGNVCAIFYLDGEGKPIRIRLYDQRAYYKQSKEPFSDSNLFGNATLAVLPKWRFIPYATEGLREIPSRYCIDFNLADGTRSAVLAERKEFDEQRDEALAGNPVAQYALASKFESYSRYPGIRSYHQKKFADQAQQLFLYSARGGHADGQFRVARDLLTGNQCQKDISKGVAWLTFAAQQGHAESQYLLGSRLLHGEGVERNPAKAGLWLKLAAESGHSRAKIDYAYFLLRFEPDRREEALLFLPDSPNANDVIQLEAAALAKALAGEFPAAVDYQQQALAIAEEVGLTTTSRAAALARYQAGQLPELATL